MEKSDGYGKLERIVNVKRAGEASIVMVCLVNAKSIVSLSLSL